MEGKLWQELQNGNEEAFMKLYNQSYQVLYSFGSRVHANSQVVKDTIHEMFCELWDQHARLPQVENVRAYLFTYLKRKLLREITIEVKHHSFVREDSSRPQMELSYEDMLVNLETDEETRNRLRHYLQKLTPAQLQIIQMKYYEGLSYEQIAHQLQLQPRTVYNRVYESLQLLRKYLNLLLLLGITLP
ncbi:hypothetical protein GCM10011379_08060 [Filimonas zeae]|uniref:RNA polymerase sigma factor 70 region 4 type 2 domain-containing protein n=2 Tax=Filimonas zeae TaxID=1737353 RepID=A0A917IPA6_9BACT|nr:hypothetical protein GCM10011379_08060 [Filimonas zeae]